MNQWYTTRVDDAPGLEREGADMRANDESLNVYDPTEKFRGDWSWRPQLYSNPDPGYTYTSGDIAEVYPSGYEAGRPFMHSRRYPEYRGNPSRPARIGSYVG